MLGLTIGINQAISRAGKGFRINSSEVVQLG